MVKKDAHDQMILHTNANSVLLTELRDNMKVNTENNLLSSTKNFATQV